MKEPQYNILQGKELACELEKEGYSRKQVQQLVYAVQNGINDEQLALLRNVSFSGRQIFELYRAFRSGISIESVSTFAHPAISHLKIGAIVQYY